MSNIGDINRGFAPLRHHDAEYSAGNRRVMRGIRTLVENNEEDYEDAAPVTGAIYLPATAADGDRKGVGAWAFSAVPVIAAERTGLKEDIDLTARGGVFGYRPLANGLLYDDGFDVIEALSSAGSGTLPTADIPFLAGLQQRPPTGFPAVLAADVPFLGWRTPAGWPGVLTAGTDPDGQRNIFHPDFAGIATALPGAAVDHGTPVYGVPESGQLNSGDSIAARFQTLITVAELNSGEDVVALDLREQGQGRAASGVVVAPSVTGPLSEGFPARLSSIICSGDPSGFDIASERHRDRNLTRDAHVRCSAPFIDARKPEHDGRLEFQEPEHPATRRGTIPLEVDLKWARDTRTWRWSVLQIAAADPTEPPPGPPGDPETPGDPAGPLDPIDPTDPGDGLEGPGIDPEDLVDELGRLPREIPRISPPRGGVALEGLPQPKRTGGAVIVVEPTNTVERGTPGGSFDGGEFVPLDEAIRREEAGREAERLRGAPGGSFEGGDFVPLEPLIDLPPGFPGIMWNARTAYTPHEFHAPGFAFRATPVLDAYRDDTRAARELTFEQIEKFRCLPVVGHFEAIGAERAGNGGFDCPPQKDESGRQRYRDAADVNGCIVLLPGNLGAEAHRDNWAPSGVDPRTVHLALLPNYSRLAFAEPDPTTGGIKSGSVMYDDGSGLLRLDDVDASGTVTAGALSRVFHYEGAGDVLTGTTVSTKLFELEIPSGIGNTPGLPQRARAVFSFSGSASTKTITVVYGTASTLDTYTVPGGAGQVVVEYDIETSAAGSSGTVYHEAHFREYITVAGGSGARSVGSVTENTTSGAKFFIRVQLGDAADSAQMVSGSYKVG